MMLSTGVMCLNATLTHLTCKIASTVHLNDIENTGVCKVTFEGLQRAFPMKKHNSVTITQEIPTKRNGIFRKLISWN